jgi:hypothetical protein
MEKDETRKIGGLVSYNSIDSINEEQLSMVGAPLNMANIESKESLGFCYENEQSQSSADEMDNGQGSMLDFVEESNAQQTIAKKTFLLEESFMDEGLIYPMKATEVTNTLESLHLNDKNAVAEAAEPDSIGKNSILPPVNINTELVENSNANFSNETPKQPINTAIHKDWMMSFDSPHRISNPTKISTTEMIPLIDPFDSSPSAGNIARKYTQNELENLLEVQRVQVIENFTLV